MNKNRLRLFFRVNLLLLNILLFIIVFCQVFSYRTFDPSNLIDGSWSISLADFKHNNIQNFGLDVMYTYGPLSTKIITVVHPKDTDNNYISNIIILSIIFFVILIPLNLIFYNSSFVEMIGLIIIWLYCIFQRINIDSLFYLLVLVLTKNFYLKKNIFIYIFPIIILSFYKNTFLLLSIVSIPIIFFKKRIDFKYILNIIIGLSLLYLVFYATTSLSVVDFLKYIYTSIINSFYYSDFMAMHTTLDLFGLFSFILALVYIGILKINKNPHNMILFNSFVLIFVLKQSFVRSGLDHVIIVLPIILLILNHIVVFFSKNRIFILFFYLINIVFVVNLLGILFKNILNVSILEHVRNVSKMIVTDILSPVRYDIFVKYKAESINNVNKLNQDIFTLKQEFVKYLNNNKISDDNYCIINFSNTSFYNLVFGGTVYYSPFLQNFAAFPVHYFNDKYLKLINDHSDCYVFYNDNMSSIDERVSTHDLGNVFDVLIKNYSVVASDMKGRMYLLKSNGINKTLNCNKVSSNIYFLGDNIKTIYTDKKVNKYVIEINNNMFDDLISLIYKPYEYKLKLINTFGGEMVFKTTKELLLNGITINPLYLSMSDWVNINEFNTSGIEIIGPRNISRTVSVYNYRCE